MYNHDVPYISRRVKYINNLIIFYVIYLSNTLININSFINLCLSTCFTQISVNKLTVYRCLEISVCTSSSNTYINLRFMFLAIVVILNNQYLESESSQGKS